MAANCVLYPHNWAVWGGFNKINKLTGRPPPAPEARGGQSLTKDQFVIALALMWILFYNTRYTVDR